MKAEEILRKKRAQEQQEQKPQQDSYWGRCEAHGCPLQSSISAGRKTCSYHHNTNGEEAAAITEAIKEKKQLLVKLAELSQWTAWDWEKKRPQLLGWEALPLGEDEPVTIYLGRFEKWVRQQIAERAELIMIGR